MTARAADAPPSIAPNIAALRAQVALSWSIEQRRLAALGVTDGQSVLELGCGPGFVTERLAAWLPQSPIHAIDVDSGMLECARSRLGDTANVTFHRAPVEATGLATGGADVAVSRYLFQHLRRPAAAAAEIRRVLKPGGLHVIIDVDDGLWGLAEPRQQDFARWHGMRAAIQQGHGGDRFRGRTLPRLLREAGFVDVELDVFACHSDLVGMEAFGVHLDPQQFLPLVEQGLMSPAEFGRAHVLHRRFLASPDAVVLFVGFIASGRAPS